MPAPRAPLLGILVAIALAACDAGPAPSGALPTPTTARPDPSDRPDPSAVVLDQLGGPWRVNPIFVDDAHVAIVSDACAAAARTSLGEVEANLPTALVDARGERLVTVIMADDLNAIECLAHLDESGASAAVDSVDRLSATVVAPVDKTAITIASVVRAADRPGGRTIAFGRLGPEAADAKVGFGDATVDLASKAEGWWAIWWQGAVRATSFSAVDNHDIVVGSAAPPTGDVEARVGPAAWWIDPAFPAPTASSKTIHALIREESCASGKSPKGRVEAPAIDVESASVTVTFAVRRLPGDQDCQGNAPFAVTITLPEPLGTRPLLDGGSTPPRDASKAPSG